MSILIAAVTAFDLPRIEPGFEQKKQAVGSESVAMMTKPCPVFPASP